MHSWPETVDSQDPPSHPQTETDHHQEQTSQLLNLDICKRLGLTDDDLNREVEDEHINEIYRQLGQWELVAHHLGLSGPDIEAIRAKQGIGLNRLYTLQEWKNKRKMYGQATYGVLLKALQECGCSNIVVKVCELLKTLVTSTTASNH